MKIRRPGTTEEYILERDRGSDTPTVFFGRPLTWKEMDKISNLSPMTMEDAFKINAIHQLAISEERKLTNEENKNIVAISAMDKEKHHKLIIQMAKACELALTEIKNLVDEKGAAIEMTVEEFIDAVDTGAIRELGTWIIGLSKFTEQDRKKS